MKIIVAGTRSFDDSTLLTKKLDKFTEELEEVIIISGAALGADKLGEEWAYRHKKTVIKFHPDWKKHGKAAGVIRNKEMAEYADALIAFWDGLSPGTKNMIETAEDWDLQVRVVKYKE